MPYPDLEISLHRRDVYRYSVDLRYISPKAETDDWVSGEVCFDFDELRTRSLDDEAYGRELTDRMFAEPEVRTRFAKVLGAIEALDEPLRLRLFIGPSAPELHTLRWERLMDPEGDTPLLARPDVRFSRYLASRHWRDVRLQPQTRLKTLIVIANPGNLDRYQLAPIDVDLELRTAEAGLADTAISRLTAPGEASPGNLFERLRQGVDVLVLVCHGRFDPRQGQPWLFLDDGEGAVERVDGIRFARQLESLPRPPRLVVLVSCGSGGTVSDREAVEGSEWVALGPRLAAAGVPAVVAMHGQLTTRTAELFLPAFFQELAESGGVDQAMNVARAQLLDAARPDWWKPVLFMRLRSGRIWYARGIAGGDRDPGGLDQWQALLTNIEDGSCTPILGPGLVEYLLGSQRAIARRWAVRERFPMSPNDIDNLPQVTQYLFIRHDRNYPRSKLERHLRQEMRQRYGEILAESARERLRGKGLTDEKLDEQLELELKDMPLAEQVALVGKRRMAEDPTEPHRVLASLPLPIYVTANYGDFMSDALRQEGKAPRVELYRWNDRAGFEWPESVFEEGQPWRPSRREPLVYHLFGRLAERETVVLTEDDYLDYLIGLDRNRNHFPKMVNRALTGSALLFLGFQITDWPFRVLFRSIMNREGRGFRDNFSHVAVQIDPEESHTLEPESARDYVRRYFRNAANISLYLGSAQDFIQDLKAKWDER